MSLSTYSELKASVANWIDRTNLTEQIPDFIKLAENRIFADKRSRIPPLEKKVVLEADSEGFTRIPTDYLEGISVFCDDVPLQRISLDQLMSYTAQSGTPRYFARHTYMFKFFPTPTSANQLELIYYYQPEDLSDTNATNVMFDQAPSVYLYGALVEAAKYLGADGSRWEEGYQTGLNKLLEHSRGAEFSGSIPVMQAGYA